MIISLGLGSMDYTEIARLCAAKAPNTLRGMRPLRLVTDSREIQKGDFFCALKDMDDGHKYVAEAKRRGAFAVLAERDTGTGLPHIIVPSVRRALADWAIGASNGPKLLRIGITGSVGKTTTKDAVAAVLSSRYSVHATYGNFNNDLGLPFTLLSLPKGTEIAVCELGVNHPGEMEELSRILRPHISLITCIGHAHIGAFGTRRSIAYEKLNILLHAKENGVLFVPTGEELLSCILPRGIRRVPVSPFDKTSYAYYALPAFRDDAAKNFALGYACAIGRELSLSEGEIAFGLERALSLETHRHEIQLGGMVIIDDGYNASPESMLCALRYLHTKAVGRRIAVLGDMLELGENSERYHRAVGRHAAENTDRLFFFGAYAKDYAKGAYAAGARPAESQENSACRYSIIQGDKEELASEIVAVLTEGDTVLFKASRAQRVEKIIEQIKKRFFE